MYSWDRHDVLTLLPGPGKLGKLRQVSLYTTAMTPALLKLSLTASGLARLSLCGTRLYYPRNLESWNMT